MAVGPEREEEAAARGGSRVAGSSRQTPLIIRCECSTRPLAKRSRWCLPTASAARDRVAGEALGDPLGAQARLGRLHPHQRPAPPAPRRSRIALRWLTWPSGTGSRYPRGRSRTPPSGPATTVSERRPATGHAATPPAPRRRCGNRLLLGGGVLVGDRRGSTSSAAPTLPRWWSHRIGDQVDGSLHARASALGPVLRLRLHLPAAPGADVRVGGKRVVEVRAPGDRGRAVVLALPEPPHPRDRAGQRQRRPRRRAHARRRGPELPRRARLVGAIVGALAVIGLRYLLLSRRRAKGARGGAARRAEAPATRPPTAARRPTPSSRVPVRISFVCLGNICRSPTGGGRDAPPDRRGRPGGRDRRGERRDRRVARRPAPRRARAIAEARAPGDRHGGPRAAVRRRPTSPASTSCWRWTRQNAADLRAHRPRPARTRRRSACCGSSTRRPRGGDLDVPDPYFGGPDGFADVFDMVERACAGLLEHLRAGAAGAAVTAALVAAASRRPPARARVGRGRSAGGSINRALRVALADGRRLFVKHRRGRARGHRTGPRPTGCAGSAEAGALRTPAVVAVGDAAPAALPRPGVDRPRPRGGPAATRPSAGGSPRSTAPAPRRSASPRTTSSAACPSPTRPLATWAEFYAARRLEPLARRAVDAGALPASAPRRGSSACGPGCPSSAARPRAAGAPARRPLERQRDGRRGRRARAHRSRPSTAATARSTWR